MAGIAGSVGTTAQRPNRGERPGSRYHALDVEKVFEWNGAVWFEVEREEYDQTSFGIVAPPLWGATWYPARLASTSRLVKVGLVAASLAVGDYASDKYRAGAGGLIRTDLQSRYGDGGSGIICPGHAQSPPPAGGAVTTPTGAWTDVDNEGGVTKRSVRPTVPGTPGATQTFIVRGRVIRVFFKSNPTWGSWAWTIDGQAQTALNFNQAAAMRTVTVDRGAGQEGNHTVVITQTGDGRLYGVSGENTTGLLVHNLSISGQNVRDMSTPVALLSATDTTDNTTIARTLNATGPFDLLIYALTPNEILVDPPANWALDMQTGLDHIWAQSNKAGLSLAVPPDMVYITEHVGNLDVLAAFSQYSRDWNEATVMAQDWARVVGAAEINLWAYGRRSWSYWNNLSYWGDSANPGPAGTDPIHLSDLGHRDAYARPVLAFLNREGLAA